MKGRLAMVKIFIADDRLAGANRRAHRREKVFAGILCDRRLGFGIRMLDEFRREFLEKRRGLARQQLAVFLAPAAMADGQRLHRARHGDVKQPPFLVHRALDFRARVRQ